MADGAKKNGSDVEDHAEFAWNTHAYVNEYIRFGDAKAGAVIAWSSALLGLLFSSGHHKLFVKTNFTTEHVDWSVTLLAVLSALAFLSLCVAFLAAVAAIKPNLTTTQQRGFIFWGNVRAYPDKLKYRQDLQDQSAKQLAHNVAEHVFDLSGVCARKYRWVNIALIAATVGSVAAVVLLLAHARLG